MADSKRSDALGQVIAAAKAAGARLSADGIDFAPLDVIKIAAALAAEHIVQTCQFGTTQSQESIADALRTEFLAQVRHFEELYLGGGERL